MTRPARQRTAAPRGRRARGFTLMELTVVLALVGITSAAIGHLYLEARAAGVQIESQVSLERRASLALEWVARDLRTGRLAPAEAGLAIDTPGGRVTYVVQDRLLVRRGPGGPRALAPHARSIAAAAVDGGHRIDLALRRPLFGSRRVEVRRSVFVGVRR